MLACNSGNDDAGVVCGFVSQVRAACAALAANPFNVDAAERLLDLLERAATADESLARAMTAAIDGEISLDVLVDEHGRLRAA
jgi:uncharacterized Ntn-hydrolase superfamily protein